MISKLAAAASLALGSGVIGIPGIGVGPTMPNIVTAGEPQPAQSFAAGRPDVGRLSDSLTINGETKTPAYRYVGANCTAAECTADGYGSTASFEESGSDPITVDVDTPFGVDTGVQFGGTDSDVYALAGSLTIGTDDVVIEAVVQFNDAAGNTTWWSNTTTDARNGFEIRTTATPRLAAVFGDGDSFTQSTSTTTPVVGAWYHLFVIADRSGNQRLCVNGISEDVDDIATGEGGTLAQSDLYLGGRFNGGNSGTGAVALAQVWQGAGWLDTDDHCEVALERSVALMGLTFSPAVSSTYISHGRDSVGYMSDENGLLHLIGNDLYRVGYSPAGTWGFLSEDDATNEFVQSEFAASWTEIDVGDTTTPANSTAPTGLTDATTLVADSTDGQHGLTQAVTLAGTQTYTFSVFAKAGDQTHLYVEDQTVAHSAYFDLSDCTVDTTASVIETFTESLTSSWCRVGFSFAGTAAAHTFAIMSAPSDADNTFAGDGATVNTEIFGAQLEDYETFTSYVETTTAAASRADDDNQMTLLSTVDVSGGWAARCDYVMQDYTNTLASGLLTVIDDLNTSFIALLPHTSDSLQVTSNSPAASNCNSITTADHTDGLRHTGHGFGEDSNCIASVDDVEDASPDTSYALPTAALTKMKVGGNNGSSPNAWIESCRIYEEPLRSTETP